MSIIKNRLIKNFCILPNLIITDKELNAVAFRIYAYLVSKPDGWQVVNQDIIKNLDIGRDSLTNALKQLIKSGWITRSRHQDSTGKLTGVFDYQLNEYKIKDVDNQKTTVQLENPLTDKNRTTGKPVNGKTRAHNNTKINNNKTDINNNNTPLPPNFVTDIDVIAIKNENLSTIKEVRKCAWENWKQEIERLDMHFTNSEMTAIYGYAISKPTIPIHFITTHLIQLYKWATEDGRDIRDSLLRSITTKALIMPNLMIKNDDLGNKLTPHQCIDKRWQQIEREQQEKESTQAAHKAS